MVLGIAFSRPILTAMHTKDELMADALLYLRIYLCGMPALGLYNFGNAVLSAAGDTKRPLYYLLFSGVVNVVLNLFFVIVCRWSVAGVAAASIFSQYLSAFLILYVLFRSTEGFGLRFQAIKLKYNIMKRVMQIGIPAAYRGGNLYLSISLSGALYR